VTGMRQVVVTHGLRPEQRAALVRDQHERLHQIAWSLSRTLETAALDPRGTAPEAARALLSELDERLATHFAYEEECGVLALALEAAPRFTREAESLFREHRMFAHWVSEIRAQAEAAPARVEPWLAVREAFAGLRARLSAHERSEGEILQRAYSEDLGGSD